MGSISIRPVLDKIAQDLANETSTWSTGGALGGAAAGAAIGTAIGGPAGTVIGAAAGIGFSIAVNHRLKLFGGKSLTEASKDGLKGLARKFGL